MRFLIVTSEVTFVKDNYNQFLLSLFQNHSKNIIGLVVLKNNNSSMIIKGLGLIAIGAKETGKNLIINSINSKRQDHEKIATQFGIKTYYFKSANDQKFIEFVKEEKIDLIVNARTRDIYKRKILKTPLLGCINIHHGILPSHRGTMCDLYALFENRGAGFSIHKMEKKIDDGAIIHVETVTPPKSINAKNFPAHIYESSKKEGKVLASLLDQIAASKAIPNTISNISDKIIYTKNPDRNIIKKMLKKGMIL